MFWLEKRCVRLKARACADEQKKMEKIIKEDAAYPTVVLEIIMITS